MSDVQTPASVGVKDYGGRVSRLLKPRAHLGGVTEASKPMECPCSRSIMNSNTTHEGWYYAHEGQSVGPLSFEALQNLLREGFITAETMVVEQGGEDWQPLDNYLSHTETTPPPFPHAETDNVVQQKPSTLRSFLPWIAIYIALIVLRHVSANPDGGTSAQFHVLLLLCSGVGFVAMLCGKGHGAIGGISGGVILAVVFTLVVNLALIPFTPSTDEPPKRTTQASKEGSKPWKPTPPKAYVTPTVNEQQKLEILALFEELQSFRDAPEFHAYGFSKAGKLDWRNRVRALGENARATDDSGIKFAANALDALGMEYHRKKGAETDSSRLNRETIEEQTGLHEIVTKRRPSDFEGVLSGRDRTVIGGIGVTSAGDLIAETMGQRIDWSLTERFLIRGDTLDARLTRYDDGFLYYVTPDSQGRLIPFVLRRMPDIESVAASGYANPGELYDSLLKGEAAELDPLKKGHILITSGTTMADYSADKKGFADYKEATGGKLDQFGKEGMITTLCRVRVIHLSGE